MFKRFVTAEGKTVYVNPAHVGVVAEHVSGGGCTICMDFLEPVDGRFVGVSYAVKESAAEVVAALS